MFFIAPSAPKQQDLGSILEPHHGQHESQWDELGLVHASVLEVEPPDDDFNRTAELRKIVDADTLKLRIDQGWSGELTDNVRLAWLNAPESTGAERPAGLWVTERVHQWVSERGPVPVKIHSEKFKLGSFRRCVCNVWMAGECLNHWLLSNKYAWPADRDGQIIGDRNIDRLNLPDEIKRHVRMGS